MVYKMFYSECWNNTKLFRSDQMRSVQYPPAVNLSVWRAGQVREQPE